LVEKKASSPGTPQTQRGGEKHRSLTESLAKKSSATGALEGGATDLCSSPKAW